MVGATVSGGASHGLAVLSHAERQAANHALAKLKTLGSGLASHLGGSSESATVYGGSTLKTIGLRASTGPDGVTGLQQRADRHPGPYVVVIEQGRAGAPLAAFAY